LAHYRVTEGDVLAAHDDALAFGGKDGIISMASILSAIGRPYTGYYPKIEQKAAALVQSLAGNHGFVDGNKRTCLLVLSLFLKRSGYGLGEPDAQLNDDLEQLIVNLASNALTYTQTVDWFKARLIKL